MTLVFIFYLFVLFHFSFELSENDAIAIASPQRGQVPPAFSLCDDAIFFQRTILGVELIADRCRIATQYQYDVSLLWGTTDKRGFVAFCRNLSQLAFLGHLAG